MARRGTVVVPLVAVLVAVVISAPALVSAQLSTATACTDNGWACTACTATAFGSDLDNCKKCVGSAGGGNWACVNECPKAIDKTACLDCVSTVKGGAWKCSACNGITDPIMRSACYTCAMSSLDGWFCQRLVQTSGCYSPSDAFNTPTSGCLGCMALGGGNKVDLCMQCAAKATGDLAKQACFDCATKLRTDWTVYQCPDATATAYTQCVNYNGEAYEPSCKACLANPATSTPETINKCAWCTRAGKTGADLFSCMAKSQVVDWAFFPSGAPSITAQCGGVLVFSWNNAMGNHNVLEINDPTSLKDVCQATDGQFTAVQTPAVQPAVRFTTKPVVLDKNGDRVFICNVGGPSKFHCTSPTANMKLTVTTKGC